MVRFQTLGGLDLRGHDGRELLSVLAQSKRLALLSYLAIATPRGYHRRDVLLGLLWPELDEKRARAALNKATHYLRASVGADVLISRGHEDLGLDWARFWCDAAGFEAALDRGETAEGLALYRGDLLRGFYVEESAEFEAWVERERTRLRDRAVHAARDWSVQQETAGQLPAALDSARRAVEWAPFDESATRRLMVLLEQTQGRAAALHAYDELAEKLQHELAVEPAAETRALRDAMRARDLQPKPTIAAPPLANPAYIEPVQPAPREPERAVDPPAAAHVRPARRMRAPILAASIFFVVSALVWVAASTRSRTTTSATALKAYERGQIEERAGRYSEAARDYRTAVEADSSFALAYLNLSSSANWTGDHALARWAAIRAEQHSGKLESIDRLRVRAWSAYLNGRPLEAARDYRAILADHPDDANAWLTLGEVLFHWGPLLGWPTPEASGAFERVLALMPNNAAALIHLARITGNERTATSPDTLFARATRLELDTLQSLELHALHAFILGGKAEQDSVSDALVRVDDDEAAGVVTTVAAAAPAHPHLGNLTAGLRTPGRGMQRRVHGALLDAQVVAARGRIDDAFGLLQPGADLPGERAIEYRAALATMPFIALPAAELLGLRGALSEMPNATGLGPGVDHLSANAVLPHRRHFLIALLSLRLEDMATAERHLHILENELGDGIGQDLSRIVRAELLRARHHDKEALAALGPARPPVDNVLPFVLSYPLAHERFLRAELLYDINNVNEALRWYGTFPDPAAYDLMYLAPVYFRRAQIHDRLGDKEAARIGYLRVIQLWNDADSRFQPWLTAARARANSLAR